LLRFARRTATLDLDAVLVPEFLIDVASNVPDRIIVAPPHDRPRLNLNFGSYLSG
jgi:hypothetical protein